MNPRLLAIPFVLASLTTTAVVAAPSDRAEQEIEQLKALLSEQQKRLDQQAQENEKQKELLEEQSEALQEQRKEFESLAERLDKNLEKNELHLKELKKIRGAGAKRKHSRSMPEVVGSDRKPEDPERPPEIAAYIEEGGVLLPKGNLVITPELGYLNSSATRVAIEGFSVVPALNIGLFEVSELSRDTITAALGLRYGVTNRFEVDMKVPYLYREDSTRNRPIGTGSSSDILSQIDGSGLGDIEFGAHYQMNDGKDDWPYLIANLRFKTNTGSSPFEMNLDPSTGLQTELPTGSGFLALQPSITAIYPTDPGVFYGNLGYLFNFKDNVGGTVGEIDPGDSISASLGLSVALNDKSAFSLGYSHSTVFETKQNDVEIANSRKLQVGAVNLGYSHRLSDAVGVNFNVSAGITEDAPDANVVMRVPLRYHLF